MSYLADHERDHFSALVAPPPRPGNPAFYGLVHCGPQVGVYAIGHALRLHRPHKSAPLRTFASRDDVDAYLGNLGVHLVRWEAIRTDAPDLEGAFARASARGLSLFKQVTREPENV